MKKYFFNIGNLLCLAMIMLCFKSYGQNNVLQITQINPANGLTTCLDARTFQLVILNTSTVTQTNLNVIPTFPSAGITFAGTVAVDVGTVSVSDPTPSMPIFLIPQILAGDTITLSYTAKASCSVISEITNNVLFINQATINYDSGTSSLTGAVSYNVVTADIGIDVVPSISTVNNGFVGELKSPFTMATDHRIIQVRNGGEGATDTVVITIIPEAEIQYARFYDANNAVIPSSNVVITPTLVTITLYQYFVSLRYKQLCVSKLS